MYASVPATTPGAVSECRDTRRRIGQLLARQPLRQAEVQHLDLTVRRHDDVGALEVAMHDAAAMRMGQRVGHLLAVAQRPPRPAADPPPRGALSGCPSTSSIAMNVLAVRLRRRRRPCRCGGDSASRRGALRGPAAPARCRRRAFRRAGPSARRPARAACRAPATPGPFRLAPSSERISYGPMRGPAARLIVSGGFYICSSQTRSLPHACRTPRAAHPVLCPVWTDPVRHKYRGRRYFRISSTTGISTSGRRTGSVSTSSSACACSVSHVVDRRVLIRTSERSCSSCAYATLPA